MPVDILNSVRPADFIREAQRGWKRFRPNRDLMRFTTKLLLTSAGVTDEGETSFASPLPLCWNAVRVLVPQLVMSFPKHTVETPYLPARQYAENLSIALSLQDKKQRITDVYRTIIVDAMVSLGIMKTGLAAGGDVLETVAEDGTATSVDNGEIYTERVSFDRFIADPDSREYLFSDARFTGNILRVPRQVLLDDPRYDPDLVTALQRADDESSEKERVSSLTMGDIDSTDNSELEDIVEIAEIWIPSANVVVTIPGDMSTESENFISIADYKGVREGPFTYLALTPPIPDNPLPVPLMSVLYKLELTANRMCNKIMEQADRQKDIIFYRSGEVEAAKMAKDAADGEMISCDDPNAINKMSFGGQESSNEEHLNMLMAMFNTLAGNVETLQGVNDTAKSATAANILQQNTGIGLSDMENAIYKAGADEARKRAFYLHTDPLMNTLISKKVMTPGQMAVGPNGAPAWVVPPTIQEVQQVLTPEQRSGDFLDLVFTFEPSSMGRLDSKARLQAELTFVQNVMPSILATAQTAAGVGMGFDAATLLWRVAKDMQIDFMDQILFSPQIQLKGAMEYNSIQQATGEGIPPNQQNPPMMNQVAQNGQPGAVQAPPPGPQQQQAQGAQAGVEDAQRLIRQRFLNNPPPKPGLASGPAVG
jgi:hypothetical protein